MENYERICTIGKGSFGKGESTVLAIFTPLSRVCIAAILAGALKVTSIKPFLHDLATKNFCEAVLFVA